MPGTHDEYLAYAAADEGPHPDAWGDGTAVTAGERRDLDALRAYRRHYDLNARRDPGPQKAALKLLRSFLSPCQRKQLRNGKAFLVRTPAGRTYRLSPGTGAAERVTAHGRRWFGALSFCLHDDPDGAGKRMPPADLSLSHMLWLLSDEDGFLAAANARNARDQLWNREYLRRLRERTA